MIGARVRVRVTEPSGAVAEMLSTRFYVDYRLTDEEDRALYDGDCVTVARRDDGGIASAEIVR